MTETRTAWAILPTPVPATLDSPDAWGIHGTAAVRRATEMARVGHDDLASRAPEVLEELRERAYSHTVELVAVPADASTPTATDVVGCAYASMPLTSNPHLAYVGGEVHPEHRGQGIGTALLDAAEHVATDQGRTTLVLWTEQVGEPAEGAADALVPPTGAGIVRAGEPGVRLAMRRGYVLEQAERYSVLQLPLPRTHLEDLHDAAADHAGTGYRVHTWVGSTPADFVAPMARLRTRMSTDVPTADLDLEEDPWDEDRVRQADARLTASGKGSLTSAVEHLASGDLVAYSRLEFPLDRAEAVHQEDTLVLREHRGHRLGMLVKTEQLLRLSEVRPGVRRIHTWNAEENAHMLAINVALGFRPQGVVGMWQKRLA